MADAIHTVREGNNVDAFSDGSDVILNSESSSFLTNRSAQAHNNWMQLWLVEDSETDCDFV